MKNVLVSLVIISIAAIAINTQAAGDNIYHHQINTSTWNRSPVPGGAYYPGASNVDIYNWESFPIHVAAWMTGPDCWNYQSMVDTLVWQNGGNVTHLSQDFDQWHSVMYAWCPQHEGSPHAYCYAGLMMYECK